MVPGQSQKRDSKKGSLRGQAAWPAKKDFKIKRAEGEVPAPPSAGVRSKGIRKSTEQGFHGVFSSISRYKGARKCPQSKIMGNVVRHKQPSSSWMWVHWWTSSCWCSLGEGYRAPSARVLETLNWEGGLRVMLASRDPRNPLDSFEIQGLWPQESLPRQAVRSSSSKTYWTTKSSLLQDTQGSCRQTFNTNPRSWPRNTVLCFLIFHKNAT